MEHWVIDYIVLPGSPTESADTPGSVWQRLDEIKRTPLLHSSGRLIPISAYGIDSGGHHTQDVYNYGMARKRLNCVVLHGSPRPHKPIMSSMPSKVDIDWGGTKVKGGVELWTVGTDVAKDWLSNRMQLTEGSGAMHFHQDLPPAWFDMMVVEQPRIKFIKGRSIREWFKPPGARNEAWDLSVYNLALAHQLGLHKWSAMDWKRLRDKLIPPNLDLFAPASVASVAPVPMQEPLPPVALVPASAPAVQLPAAQSIPTPEPEPTAQTVQAPVPPPSQPAVSEPVAPAAQPVAAPAPLAPIPVATAINRAPVGRRILSRGIR